MFDNPTALVAVISIVVNICAGLGFVWAIKSSVAVLENRLSTQDDSIGDIKTELKELAKVVTTQAVHDVRMGGFETRLGRLESHYEELRHGEGFVLPIGDALKRR